MPRGNPIPIRPGDRLGRLVVEAIVEYDPNYGAVVRCRCDCGGTVERIASQLRAIAREAAVRGFPGPGCTLCAYERKRQWMQEKQQEPQRFSA